METKTEIKNICVFIRIVKHIKSKIKQLPCLNIPHPSAKLIVEMDASDLGFGGILKQ